MNGAIAKPHPNIYKLIDIIKEQEQLGAINFGRANLGTKKSRRTKEELKDAQIECLKLKYETGLIDCMDYLMKVSSFVKEFD